jgi:hypothetical protein
VPERGMVLAYHVFAKPRPLLYRQPLRARKSSTRHTEASSLGL